MRAGEAASLSSYIAQAVDQKRDHDDLLAMLAELALESGGPLSASERAVARADLGLADGRRPRKGGSSSSWCEGLAHQSHELACNEGRLDP